MSFGPEHISVIVPAYNEAKCLPATLGSIVRAREFLVTKEGGSAEILLVNNDGRDQTARIAADLRARVIQESEHNTLVWTNPLLIAMYQRRAAVWRGWYQEAPR